MTPGPPAPGTNPASSREKVVLPEPHTPSMPTRSGCPGRLAARRRATEPSTADRSGVAAIGSGIGRAVSPALSRLHRRFAGRPHARGARPAKLGEGPGQLAGDGATVDGLDPEGGEMAARHDHSHEAAPPGAPVVARDEDLGAPVAPLRRQHPHLRARREVLDSPAQAQTALAVRGLPGDVRHHAEQRGLLPITHEPMIGTAGRAGNRDTDLPRRARILSAGVAGPGPRRRPRRPPGRGASAATPARAGASSCPPTRTWPPTSASPAA